MHESEVAQSCPTLCNPMDCSLPGFSVHEIFQTRVLSGMPLPSPHPYMTTGKSTALTRWTSDSKVMSLCFNRLVIAFLPRSRHLLASWLQSPSAVILEPRKIKSVTVSIFSPFICHEFNSVQSLSHVRLFATPWITARQASLSITNSQSLLKLMSIESVMPSSYLILCHPLLLLPPIPHSIRVFPNESTLCMRWPKYWSFSFSNEHPGLISFRMDWLDLLAVQGTLKSLLQHHSSKDQFFGVQLSAQSNSHIHTWPLEKP